MKKFYIYFLLNIFFYQINIAQNNCIINLSPVEDNYFGTKVIDHYRNLENTQSEEFINWITCQNSVTRQAIDANPAKEKLKAQFLEKSKETTTQYTNFSFGKTRNCYFLKKIAGETYYKLYTRKKGSTIEELLFDPKTYQGTTGKQYVISYFNLNHKEDIIAIALTEGGKEFSDVLLYDVKTKKILPEIIKNAWPAELYGINWLPDDTGFILAIMSTGDKESPQFMKDTQTYLYKIGTSFSQAKVIFSKNNNPDIFIPSSDYPLVTIENNFLIGSVAGVHSNYDTYIASITDLKKEQIAWKPLYKKEAKINQYLIDKNEVIFISNLNDNVIGKCSLQNLPITNFTTIVKPIKDQIIQTVVKAKIGFYFTTLKNGIEAHLYYYSNQSYKEIILPFKAGNISVKASKSNEQNLDVQLSGWTQKEKQYLYNAKNKTFAEIKFDVNDSNNYDDIEIEEIEIKTHDGLNLPLTILYKKGFVKNGKNRTIMQGYGSYGIINSPIFLPNAMEWIKNGGIYVFTHIRGGGEKGETWHKGGFKKTKPNSWKDFISCAEYLIKNKYTSTEYLGVTGSSAGGILIGRSITERPDLFKAAVIKVGSLNTLRSELSANGPNNVKEFGTVKIEEEFKALYEMDSYHHLKPNTNYPATLITAGLNDPRVVAWQPAKFAAKLQAYQASKENPILLRTNMDGGHGGSVTSDKTLEENVDVYTFFYWQLGYPDFQLKK
ncbi:MAG: prolyl oligopeptidase family serine peptidase [Limnohabitans sp.]|nr:prolyl oligopeptidase family serine peptidase [Limnohabitans sp.]